MISWEDNSCATCGASKQAHDELMKRFGKIVYPVLVRPLVARWTSNLSEPELEDSPWEYRECFKFVKSFEIFDKNGSLIPPAP